MIENEFNADTVASVNFGVCLRSSKNMYFVPTDVLTKEALTDVLRETIAAFEGVDGGWEKYDLSEEYGSRRRVYIERSDQFMVDLSAVFDAGTLADLSNLSAHAGDIEFYFAEFTDGSGRRAIGMKKGARLKATMKSRNRLVRLVDDSLVMIEDDVLRLDQEFDLIITDAHIFILHVGAMEHLAKIVGHVAAAAATKLQILQRAITFLDFSRIISKIGTHPRVARQAAAVAANPDIGLFNRDRIVEMAQQHGVVFKELSCGRLQCRVTDEARLIEILDARRYRIDLTGNGGDPYRASGRQRVAL